MMSTPAELKQQKEELESEIKRVAKGEKAEALKEVRRLCKLHGFTYNQLKSHLSPGRKRRNEQ